jgi:PTS system nitrogen regulatory IIA component
MSGMEISDFLNPDRVILDLRVQDKAHLISEAARLFCRSVPMLDPNVVEIALAAREQLGSTGLGGGFALPHARIDGLEVYLGMFLRLAKPIEFDAIDAKPVQQVFVLLVPSDATVPHVGALAAITRRFRDGGLVTRLREAKTPATAYGFLTDG